MNRINCSFVLAVGVLLALAGCGDQVVTSAEPAPSTLPSVGVTTVPSSEVEPTQTIPEPTEPALGPLPFVEEDVLGSEWRLLNIESTPETDMNEVVDLDLSFVAREAGGMSIVGSNKCRTESYPAQLAAGDVTLLWVGNYRTGINGSTHDEAIAASACNKAEFELHSPAGLLFELLDHSIPTIVVPEGDFLRLVSPHHAHLPFQPTEAVFVRLVNGEPATGNEPAAPSDDLRASWAEFHDRTEPDLGDSVASQVVGRTWALTELDTRFGRTIDDISLSLTWSPIDAAYSLLISNPCGSQRFVVGVDGDDLNELRPIDWALGFGAWTDCRTGADDLQPLFTNGAGPTVLLEGDQLTVRGVTVFGEETAVLELESEEPQRDEFERDVNLMPRSCVLALVATPRCHAHQIEQELLLN